jgi:DNA-binding MarR family transcriptional regulator
MLGDFIMKIPNDNAVRAATAHEGLAGLFTLAALLGHLMDEGLAEHGLTRARGEVLWTLHHQGAMTQRELSKALDCSPPNVTGLLDALEAAGFVARQPHPTDRRATLVTLTELGTRTVSAWSTRYDEFAATLFADVATPELSSFVTGLNRVLAQLRDAVPARPADTG